MSDATSLHARRWAQEIIDFSLERDRHPRPLPGREDVLAKLDELVAARSSGGWVVVTGGPGLGKSAILCEWLRRREAAGHFTAHHFVRGDHSNWSQPAVIIASLAAQIEKHDPELAQPEHPDRLSRILTDVSRKRVPLGERLVVLVDGLDEAERSAGNPLPRFLPGLLPTGVVFVCGMRPDYPHLDWMKARPNLHLLHLDEPPWGTSNERACRLFWDNAAGTFEPPLTAEQVQAAADNGQSNLLHAVTLCAAWRDVSPDERRADLVPDGLDALLGALWQRIVEDTPTVDGLGLLCAAREALPLHVLSELSQWSPARCETFRRTTTALLLEKPVVRFRHEWMQGYVRQKLGPSVLRVHHVRLARELGGWPTETKDSWRREYALRHALAHRVIAHGIGAGDLAGVRALATDVNYLSAKCDALGPETVERELASAARHCGDASLAAELADIQRAIRVESHRLRQEPAALGLVIWNRLRRFGWTAERIDRTFVWTATRPWLRLRHRLQHESQAERTIHKTAAVRQCAITPDGSRVVSACSDRTLKIWDLDTGTPLATLEGHTSEVLACAVTPDGRRVVSASLDGTLKIWDLDSGRHLATCAPHTRAPDACAVTPDGRRVVSASYDGTLEVWDLESGERFATIEAHPAPVFACAVTPDGRRAVSASNDGTLKVWDLDSGTLLATSGNHIGTVNDCAVTPDGRRVVSGSHRTVQVWDLDSGKLLATLEGHTDRVNACAVTPDGRRVVSASNDGTVKVWDLDAGTLLATLKGHTGSVTACAVTPDGRRVVSASNDGTYKVWELDSATRFAAGVGHSHRVTAFAVAADRRVVSASWDKTLKVWDLDSGKVLATLEGNAGVSACAVTPDGRRIVSASRRFTVWDLDTGAVLGQSRAFDATHACTVMPDGRRVISASWDLERGKSLDVWDLDSWALVLTVEDHGMCQVTAVTPDGRRVISACHAKATDVYPLMIWELDSDTLCTTVEGHTRPVSACVVTPDGRRVVSASEDKTLRVWDLDSGTPLATLVGHTAPVTACAVTPDGRRVVSASEDKTVRVWELDAGTPLATLQGDASFHAVAAQNHIIIAGDAFGNVWFLDLVAADAATPGVARALASRWQFFLAHASPDKTRASEVFDHLVRRGHQVFLDARSLKPGDAWDIEIPRALASSQVLVVLISARYADAYYLRAEIAAAIARSRAEGWPRVVPVYLDGALPTDTPRPYGLEILHSIDARAEGGLDAVAERLDELLRHSAG